MSTFNVDTSRMRAKFRAIEFAAEHARRAAVEEVGELVIDVLDDLSPKDTNRYVRAWIDAGRKAGVTDRPLPALRASRDRDRYLEKLRSQLEFWIGRRQYARARMEQYERYDASAPPRKDGKPRRKRTSQPYYKKMQKLEARASKQIERAARELTEAEGSEHAVFFDADSIAERHTNRSLSSVRDRVYGGDGRVIPHGTSVIVELRNKEPHARLVERHPHLGHPVATAKQIIQIAGAKPAGKAYRQALKRFAPAAMSTR